MPLPEHLPCSTIRFALFALNRLPYGLIVWMHYINIPVMKKQWKWNNIMMVYRLKSFRRAAPAIGAVIRSTTEQMVRSRMPRSSATDFLNWVRIKEPCMCWSCRLPIFGPDAWPIAQIFADMFFFIIGIDWQGARRLFQTFIFKSHPNVYKTL